ncbi:MAG TPA: UbiA family prenyltransferase [Gemmatimonadales bacterium]|nr:UbiA family prenyltransferase [Gemmatimonadales bacterium]
MSAPEWARAGRRQAGYRLLGPGLAYLLHTRPAEWPIMAAHTTLGSILAVGLDGIMRGERLGPALAGLGAWVIGLNGGTLAVNSAFDRDEGDVAYLRSPPPPPRRLFAFGVGLMLAGLGVACLLSRSYLAAYAICLVMSLAYSVPPLRLKAVAGADWVINMWGFGTLTPFAGWAATGTAVSPAGWLVLLAFCPLFAAFYPLTQLYQMDEDRRRGDRTLALRLGARRSLIVAAVCASLAFALLAAAGVRAGWRVGDDVCRWALLAAAALGWFGVLAPWLTGAARWSPSAHQRAMYGALGAWAVTDVAVAVAWGT